MAFEAKYHFKKNNTVVIEHCHGGTLRVSGNNNKDTGGNGGRGDFAQWEVILLGDDKVRIKSCKSGKHLRINKKGDVNSNGGEGQMTIFKVHVVDEPNVVKLESNKFGGQYIAVKDDKSVVVGNGGDNCKLTFFRNGGGGGGNNDAAAEAPAEEKNDAPAADPEPEPEAPAEAPAAAPAEDNKEAEPLSEDAQAVADWLKTIGQEAYVGTFIENGYDKMSTVSMVTEDDLKTMGVKAGHTKEIMLAARAAPFLTHKVVFRSQHKQSRYIGCDKGNKKELELDDKADPKDTWWLVEQSPNGNNLVRFKSPYDSYIRMPAKNDKHMVTVDEDDDIDERCDLQILPCADQKKQNVIRIWCPKNANFITYDDNIMKDRVNSNEESFEKDMLDKQMWELIVKE